VSLCHLMAWHGAASARRADVHERDRRRVRQVRVVGRELPRSRFVPARQHLSCGAPRSHRQSSPARRESRRCARPVWAPAARSAPESRPALPRALELKACASMSAPACVRCGAERRALARLSQLDHVHGRRVAATTGISARLRASTSGYPVAAGSHRTGSFSGCTPPRAIGR
jgi:hypothetical protein